MFLQYFSKIVRAVGESLLESLNSWLNNVLLGERLVRGDRAHVTAANVVETHQHTPAFHFLCSGFSRVLPCYSVEISTLLGLSGS